MSSITRIDVRVETGNRNNAGTDGTVFIAVGGREFKLNSAADDFEKGSDRTYTLGAGSTVIDPGLNNPHAPFELDTVDLDKFPVWVRFEPSGDSPDWNLEFVAVTVNPSGPNKTQYEALRTTGNLWLGQSSGKYCFLKRA